MYKSKYLKKTQKKDRLSDEGRNIAVQKAYDVIMDDYEQEKATFYCSATAITTQGPLRKTGYWADE